ncbi:MAG: hypothetical protein HY608_10220, partial [Planctomycetes bacterium]|nr:hypothetical protein [Planctomycetota bacterium]
GIEEFVARGDLLDRTMLVYTPAIPDGARRSERTFWQEFEREAPAIFGAILDALASALRNVGSVHLESVPRMRDSIEWVTAAEGTLGWPAGAFLAAYKANCAEAEGIAFESSPVAAVLLRHLRASGGNWEGTAGDLLGDLGGLVDPDTKHWSAWPRTPKGMSSALRRLEPTLRAAGVVLEFDRTPGSGSRRLIRIRTTGGSTVAPTQTDASTRGGSDGATQGDGCDGSSRSSSAPIDPGDPSVRSCRYGPARHYREADRRDLVARIGEPIGTCQGRALLRVCNGNGPVEVEMADRVGHRTFLPLLEVHRDPA